jgi:hypothetical protein
LLHYADHTYHTYLVKLSTTFTSQKTSYSAFVCLYDEKCVWVCVCVCVCVCVYIKLIWGFWRLGVMISSILFHWYLKNKSVHNGSSFNCWIVISATMDNMKFCLQNVDFGALMDQKSSSMGHKSGFNEWKNLNQNLIRL